ncbi:hypothetical protein JCM5353_004941 [Sporobolomyces roseus]
MNRSQSSLIAIRLVSRKVTSSRLIYVLLIDTALTFILFTSIFHSHLTSLSHLQSIVQLCSTLPPSPSASPAATLCSSSRLSLRETPTLLQRFLLVTREILSSNDATGEGFETMRFKRNTRVGLFVLTKVLVVAGLFIWMSSTRSTTEEEGGISLEHEEVEKDEKLEITILPTSTSTPPPSYATSTLSRPSSNLMAVPTFDEEEEEEDRQAEEDLPWIFLAVSLILHLSVVLFDRGALDPIGKCVMEVMHIVGQSVEWKWVALGVVNVLLVGLGRRLYASVVKRRREGEQKGGEQLLKDEKSELVVLTI